MVRNYYTLLHTASEIESLAGWAVDECFTQDKDTLIVSLNDGKRECFIVFTADGKYDSIYLKHSFGKARRNATNLLQDLEGDVLQSAEVLGKSRIVCLKFLHSTVYAVLFGGVYSNFIILNSDDLIFDAFKKGLVDIGKPFEIPTQDEQTLDSFSPDTPIKSALANSNYLFGNTYTGEVFARLENTIDPKSLISELSTEQINSIIFQSEKLKIELENSEKFYVFENERGKKIMSPVYLKGYEFISEYDSVSEAIHRKNVSDLVEGEFKTEFTKIKNFLDKQERKLSKAIENMQDIDSAIQREAVYRLQAEVLMSNPRCRDKVGSEITTIDFSGNEIIIKLDPKLNLVENAKKYFDKAHSTNEDIKVRKIRLPEMLEKLEAVREKINELQKVKYIKELSRFESTIKQTTGKRVNTKKMTMEEKFRKYELGEGYVLYAGKNASNNDELTMKFANQNDVWLHARGSSGSHTIIRMDKEEKPPKQILQKAAEITAYYSGARNAKYVPVIWTFKKYVRKPKGANVGAVVVSKETVIMAEPKLPE